MTSVSTPVLSESMPNSQVPGAELDNLALHKQDTREYLADMLKELSAIAAWAGFARARQYIDAALHEVEAKENNS